MSNYVPILERLESNKWIVGTCWRWLGATNKTSQCGYVWLDGKTLKVTRVSAHLFLGLDLKSPLLVCHKPICKYKDCWNPEHLYIGTHQDNMNDYKATVTHCPRGHEYTPENTYIDSKGSKDCRACWKDKR